jgi:hypothetical protein
MSLQQSMRQAMESADPKAMGGHLQHILNAAPHFSRRFVSKGHGQNGVRR